MEIAKIGGIHAIRRIMEEIEYRHKEGDDSTKSLLEIGCGARVLRHI